MTQPILVSHGAPRTTVVFAPPPPFPCISHLWHPGDEKVVFNIIILVVVWPWVYIAYRRVLTNLRAKYTGQEVRAIFCLLEGAGGIARCSGRHVYPPCTRYLPGFCYDSRNVRVFLLFRFGVHNSLQNSEQFLA